MIIMYSRCFKVTAIVVGLSISIGQIFLPAAFGQSSTEKIDKLVQPYLDSQTLVGLSVGILNKGQSTFIGYGSTTSSSGESVSKPDENTLYEIGSISKVFTSILLADAVNRGLLRLDQPIIETFPTEFSQPNKSLEKITFQHLSTHTSGLPRMPTNFDLSNVVDPYVDYDEKLLFDFLHDHKLTNSPGKKSEYSNLGVGLMGCLIAQKQKLQYEQLLQERILRPLEMTDSGITLSDEQKKRVAQGFDGDGSRQGNWNFAALGPAGAIRSSVKDMLKFAQANLHPSGPLKDAMTLAWQVHQPALTSKDRDMGLGWFVAADKHTRFHNGQTGGYHSMLYVSQKLDLAVVVLSNTASSEVDRLAEEIYKLEAGDPVEPRKFEPVLQVPGEILERYVGVYELVPGVDFTVSTKDGKLLVGLTGQPTVRVYPKSETQWSYKIVKAEITFRKDKQGNWNELVLFQNGMRQRAVRKADSSAKKD